MISSRDTTYNDFIPCVVCGKKITPTCGKPLEWLPCTHPVNASSASFDGVVGVISAGFGSSFDTDNFVIAICDGCIERSKGIGVFNVGGPMHSDDEDVRSVDHLIEEWHHARCHKITKQSLAEFLCLSDDEYAAYVECRMSSSEVIRLRIERIHYDG